MCLPAHTRTHRAGERNRGDESSSDYNPPHVEIINERLRVCCLYRAALLDNHQGRQTPNNITQVRLKRGGARPGGAISRPRVVYSLARLLRSFGMCLRKCFYVYLYRAIGFDWLRHNIYHEHVYARIVSK